MCKYQLPAPLLSVLKTCCWQMRITCLEHLSAFKLRLYVDYASNPATAIHLLFKLHCFNLHRTTRFQAVYEEPDRHNRCWLVVMLDCLESLVTNLCIGNVLLLDISVVLENFVPMAKEISLDCNHKFIFVIFLVPCCIPFQFGDLYPLVHAPVML